MSKVNTALKSTRKTEELIIGSEVINSVYRLFNDHFPYHITVIIADRAAVQTKCKQVKRYLKKQNLDHFASNSLAISSFNATNNLSKLARNGTNLKQVYETPLPSIYNV
jgi:hypothetical protein